MTTPLYELVRYKDELERLSDSGEIPPEEIAETLELLDGDIRDKAINVAAYTRNLDASAVAIRAAGKAMLERADRIERRADGVRAYLLFQMQAVGLTKIECPWFTLTVRKNPPTVVIDDEKAIPPAFMVQPEPPPPRPDKAKIKDAIKGGKDVPGVHLTQSERLEVKE